MRPILLLFALFLLVSCSDTGSTTIEKDSNVKEKQFLISEVKKNLNTLSKPFLSEEEYRYEIALATVDMIVDLVNKYDADLNEFDGLYLDAGIEGKLSIYNFSLGSLCTSSTDFPIVVWKTASSHKAQKLDWDENISSVHELDTVQALYLVLTSSKLSGSEYIGTAHTLQIHDDTINFSHSVFDGHPYMSVYNGFFSYDEQTGTLVCKLYEDAALAESWKFEAYKDNTYPDSNYTNITRIDSGTQCFSLKFDGEAFRPNR